MHGIALRPRAGGSVVWDALNSPFLIFVLSSIVVASLTKYWDLRQTQRYEARELYRYVLECLQRLEYVIEAFPSGRSAPMIDWWGLTNALEASGENTYYRPLFSQFSGQRIEALLTVLSFSDRRQKQQYEAIAETIEKQGEMVGSLSLVEKRAEVERQEGQDLEGLAQLWTFGELGPEWDDDLAAIRRSYAEHVAFLHRVRNAVEKRL
jgi:hypothetical protein